jgi:hypothetical protein
MEVIRNLAGVPVRSQTRPCYNSPANITREVIGAQGRTKFARSKFEHLRFLQMARRANYMEVIRNLTGVPVRRQTRPCYNSPAYIT